MENESLKTDKYQEVKTEDNTFTLKNFEYNECYHSNEGALKETYYKHVSVMEETAEDFDEEIRILDICFGLGYNTFVSILHRPRNKKLKIFSPELDLGLIKSLKDFKYPKEFDKIKHIIDSLSKDLYYKDDYVEVEVANADARKYIKNLQNIHIVYQDAFSPKVNQELWTLEYFRDLKSILNPKAVITTYSVATPVRCALYKLGFNIYTHKSDTVRKGTVAALRELNFPKVDFEEKLKRTKCRVYRDKE